MELFQIPKFDFDDKLGKHTRKLLLLLRGM